MRPAWIQTLADYEVFLVYWNLSDGSLYFEWSVCLLGKGVQEVSDNTAVPSGWCALRWRLPVDPVPVFIPPSRSGIGWIKRGVATRGWNANTSFERLVPHGQSLFTMGQTERTSDSFENSIQGQKLSCAEVTSEIQGVFSSRLRYICPIFVFSSGIFYLHAWWFKKPLVWTGYVDVGEKARYMTQLLRHGHPGEIDAAAELGEHAVALIRRMMEDICQEHGAICHQSLWCTLSSGRRGDWPATVRGITLSYACFFAMRFSENARNTASAFCMPPKRSDTCICLNCALSATTKMSLFTLLFIGRYLYLTCLCLQKINDAVCQSLLHAPQLGKK